MVFNNLDGEETTATPTPSDAPVEPATPPTEDTTSEQA